MSFPAFPVATAINDAAVKFAPTVICCPSSVRIPPLVSIALLIVIIPSVLSGPVVMVMLPPPTPRVSAVFTVIFPVTPPAIPVVSSPEFAMKSPVQSPKLIVVNVISLSASSVMLLAFPPASIAVAEFQMMSPCTAAPSSNVPVDVRIVTLVGLLRIVFIVATEIVLAAPDASNVPPDSVSLLSASVMVMTFGSSNNIPALPPEDAARFALPRNPRCFLPETSANPPSPL